MDKNGLLVEPEFDNINKYLQSGDMTVITNNIKSIADKINGNTQGIILRKIILWIQQNTIRLNSPQDDRKFKRPASEILLSGKRTGCCDSATLFTALAREKKIPTMQIITFSRRWGEQYEKRTVKGTEGHFFVASYITDINGNSNWVILNPDKYISDLREVKIEHLNKEDRNISNNYYAFAYVNDYRDVNLQGIKIDSIQNMRRIQEEAYRKCNKEDFKSREDYER